MEEYSVIECAMKMDEIWVPSLWGKEVFSKVMHSLRAPTHNIHVIPESVDTDLFHPDLATQANVFKISTNLSCSSKIDLNVNESRKESNGLESSVFQNYCLDHVFQFLSVFKWEHRKGWDVLLEAYWRAFRKEDPVVLRIVTQSPMTEHPVDILAAINVFAQRAFHRPVTDLAKIIIMDTTSSTSADLETRHELNESYLEYQSNGRRRKLQLSRENMRNIYGAADAFVLPTRGEGWGLPVAEAMAMKLPVIVTNCSGVMAYATGENAYLIPTREDSLDELGYAVPDAVALQAILKSVIQDVLSGSARIKTEKARMTMKELSPETVVRLMAERIKSLARYRGHNVL